MAFKKTMVGGQMRSWRIGKYKAREVTQRKGRWANEGGEMQYRVGGTHEVLIYVLYRAAKPTVQSIPLS